MAPHDRRKPGQGRARVRGTQSRDCSGMLWGVGLSEIRRRVGSSACTCSSHTRPRFGHVPHCGRPVLCLWVPRPRSPEPQVRSRTAFGGSRYAGTPGAAAWRPRAGHRADRSGTRRGGVGRHGQGAQGVGGCARGVGGGTAGRRQRAGPGLLRRRQRSEHAVVDRVARLRRPARPTPGRSCGADARAAGAARPSTRSTGAPSPATSRCTRRMSTCPGRSRTTRRTCR